MKENGGSGIKYFDMIGDMFKKWLERTRDKVIDGGKTSIWKIPNVKVVHVGSSGTLQMWLNVRHWYWKEAEGLECGVPFCERQFVEPSRLSPFSLVGKMI